VRLPLTEWTGVWLMLGEALRGLGVLLAVRLSMTLGVGVTGSVSVTENVPEAADCDLEGSEGVVLSVDGVTVSGGVPVGVRVLLRSEGVMGGEMVGDGLVDREWKLVVVVDVNEQLNVASVPEVVGVVVMLVECVPEQVHV